MFRPSLNSPATESEGQCGGGRRVHRDQLAHLAGDRVSPTAALRCAARTRTHGDLPRSSMSAIVRRQRVPGPSWSCGTASDPVVIVQTPGVSTAAAYRADPASAQARRTCRIRRRCDPRFGRIHRSMNPAPNPQGPSRDPAQCVDPGPQSWDTTKPTPVRGSRCRGCEPTAAAATEAAPRL